MKEEKDVIKKITELLDKSGIDYVITGSLARNMYALPRATFDTDLVIITDRRKLKKFISLIKDDFYVDEKYAMDALETKKMFNIIHLETTHKIDLIIFKGTEYDKTTLNRKKEIEFEGRKLYFISPEDIILSKLIWQKESLSDRQYEDALQVLLFQKDKLDYDYLNEWARELRVIETLKEMMKKVDEFYLE